MPEQTFLWESTLLKVLTDIQRGKRGGQEGRSTPCSGSGPREGSLRVGTSSRSSEPCPGVLWEGGAHKVAGEKPLQAQVGWVVALGVPRAGRIRKGEGTQIHFSWLLFYLSNYTLLQVVLLKAS